MQPLIRLEQIVGNCNRYGVDIEDTIRFILGYYGDINVPNFPYLHCRTDSSSKQIPKRSMIGIEALREHITSTLEEALPFELKNQDNIDFLSDLIQGYLIKNKNSKFGATIRDYAELFYINS